MGLTSDGIRPLRVAADMDWSFSVSTTNRCGGAGLAKLLTRFRRSHRLPRLPTDGAVGRGVADLVTLCTRRHGRLRSSGAQKTMRRDLDRAMWTALGIVDA
jgi:hypothetical protein